MGCQEHFNQSLASQPMLAIRMSCLRLHGCSWGFCSSLQQGRDTLVDPVLQPGRLLPCCCLAHPYLCDCCPMLCCITAHKLVQSHCCKHHSSSARQHSALYC